MHEESRSFPDVASVAMALEPSYPVVCVRPKVLEASARRFITLFPGTVLYAVKCNPHPLVLDALYRGGIRHFAIDHEDELAKVLEQAGGELGGQGLTIMVRIATPPSHDALYHLAAKFGAGLGEAVDLLRAARKCGCRVGLAFHVGSQCLEPKAYRVALALVGEVAKAAGVDLACLDVGGGFPGAYLNSAAPPLEDFMAEIRAGLKALAFKATTEIMAEPGRALAASGCSLLTQVQLRKGQQLYINDGIYGSLAETTQVDIRLPARLIRLNQAPARELLPFTLNGPTCDSLDVLPGSFELPADAREGDWIEIDQLGAYSNALATSFNGLRPETFVEVYDAPAAA